MKQDELLQVRVTGLLLEGDKLLIVKQSVDETRPWSLPGGRVHAGETLQEAMQREMAEETGLRTQIKRLAYLCDKPESNPPLIFVSFLLEKTGGEITLPTNEFDNNPISDVAFVNVNQLCDYGFSEKFQQLAIDGFPDTGRYAGSKNSIGLG